MRIVLIIDEFDSTPLEAIARAQHMKKPQLRYFEQGDVLHLTVAEGKERQSVEVWPNVTLELNAKGDVIELEILNATRFIRDFILESAQAKMLSLGNTPHEA